MGTKADTILVTGGAGFIGSHVTDSLLAMGHEVVVLDDLSGGFESNVNPGAEFVEGSILDVDLIGDIFASRRIRFVFHLAAYAAEGLSQFIKRYNYNNNLIGSVNLINASVNHDVECFVFTSSIAVYGESPCPMKEDMVPSPVDSYGIAKYAVEKELEISRNLFGLNYIVFRPHNVYGERQNIGDKYRNVVGIFMNQLMTDHPKTIFGDGEQTRAFTYIKDAAPLMAQSVYDPRAYNEIFNVGADESSTVNELARLVAEAMGAPHRVRHVEAREEVKEAYCSHEKVRAFFDQKAEYGLAEGLRAMAEWAKIHGSRVSKRFDDIEISRNLPAVWLE